MANWMNGVSESTFNAKSFSDSQISDREGTREASNVGGGWFGNGRAYSVVGIDANRIDGMRSAIRDYVQAIEGHLDGIEPLANANNAYKSEEVQRAVQEYVQKVKDYCKNLTSQLLAFSDKLGDVKSSWERATSEMSSTIGGASGSFDAGTKYTESQ